MSSPSRRPDASPDPFAAGRRRRLRQVLWLLTGAFALVIGLNLADAAYATAGLEGAIIGLLLLALWLQRRHFHDAVTLTAASLLLGLGVLVAHNQGLYDEAVLAFPALLLFAGMFGSRRLLLGLIVAVLAALLVLFWLHQSGRLPSVPKVPMDWRRPFVIGLIMTVTGLFVWMVVRDLEAILRQLEEEKAALEQSHAQIEILAQRDSLTDLPNRALAKDRLTHLLTQARRNGRMVAVMFLDLDNFKTINDSLGHIAGDALLCQVADTLRSCVRESDTVARLSGDEFLILLGDLPDEDAIIAAVANLTHRLGQAFQVEGVDVLVTASLGIAVAPRDGSDTDTLLKHADMAMYRAKDAGRNTFRFFDPSMNANLVEELHLTAALRSALGSEQLMLHYQPQIELASGRIVGAEALLRWKHPEYGWISPARFIPIAERSGLIHELGAWVLRQACLDAQSWRERGLGELGVAVNVSAAQFRRESLEHDIARALAASGLPAQALELELTESLLMADARHLANVLQRLSASGVKIAIDDFGTGYSNLGYLRNFAVDRLKVDQSFVRQMTRDSHAQGLVRAIIEMGHCLGLQVVAEGVEDAQTLAGLVDAGCERGQGFHWSPALPPQDFIAFVQGHQARG
ncbi:putative bifunctional diguanylate cyclase/phosphodiesterase [Thermomonas alba]|uniref:putative bifunctional diguanylate cyclase/phosphodiesterase n=1 Tax=Thermomonas alba TaxID=2888525 RepID=UPI001F044290|nr:EAL domain-containing protein [Thermomonas alba]